jgi:hypothetical protein
MRVVTYENKAVKRQKKIAHDKILLVFYNSPPRVVTPAQWEAGKQNKYYDGEKSRKEVVRSL